jgi:cytochrome c-type biogenesis protein CcmH
MIRKALIGTLFMMLVCVNAYAADDALSDPALETRAVALGEQLRCVVCQSESINDSQADMARDMRLLVRDKIRQGWSDNQILDFARTRYGDFILLNPPLQMNTYVLWALPAGVFIVSCILVAFLFRKRKGGARKA